MTSLAARRDRGRPGEDDTCWRRPALLASARQTRPGCPRGAREGGVNPPRPRHCNRGRNPQLPLAMSREGAGSRRIRKPGDLPGRAPPEPVLAGGPGMSATTTAGRLLVVGGVSSGVGKTTVTLALL